MLSTYIEASKSYRKATAELSKLLAPYGITPKEFEALALAQEIKTCGQIAKEMGVSLPQVTALTKELLGLKYVKQTILKKDRRVHYITATPEGWRVLERVGANE